MTKLEQLIQTYCPDGVNYKTMGELGCFYGGITGKSKDDFKDGNARFITYKNVYSNPALKMDLDDFVKIDSDENQRTLEYGDVIFTGSSECVEECGFSSVVTKQPTENLYLNSFCFIFRFNNVNCMLPDFAKHLFRSHELRRQIIKTASGVTRYNVSKEKMKKISIPVPPLPVQEEIVRILDKFTELEAELAQELARRKLQYTFYRDQLLNFESKAKTQWLNLENCCKILDNKRKPVSKSDRENGIYPYYGANGIQDYVSDYIFDGDYVLVGEDGSVMTKDGNPVVNWASGKIWVNNHAHIIEATDGVLLRYLFHYLQTVNVKHLIHGNIPKLTGKDFKEIKIPVPSIDVQQRLINVLDNFDAICSDLSIGLPAEISARQKQYEYYRDLLFEYAANGLNYSRAQQSTAEHSRADEIKLIQYVFGVVFVQLGDFAKIARGGNFQKKDFVNNGRPCIHYGQIYTKYGTSTDTTITNVNQEVWSKSKHAVTNDIVMAVTSENLDDVCKCVAWLGEESVAVSGHTAIIHHNENPKYLAYYFATQHFFQQKKKLAHGTKVVEVTPDSLNNITIPLPPREIQDKIAQMIERFDKLCNDISDGLPAEIEMRQKQYEYYRDKLLSF